MSDFNTRYQIINYYPKTGNVRNQGMFMEIIEIESIREQKETLERNPDYLTMKNGDLWFTLVIDKSYYEENSYSDIGNYLSSINSINGFDTDIIFPDKVFAIITHIGNDQKYVYKNCEDRNAYNDLIKKSIRFFSTFYN